MNAQLATLLQDHINLTYAYVSVLQSDEAQLLHLLKADLRHRRLLHNLTEAGLDHADFHLDLHTVLFTHLGFTASQLDENDLQEFYYQQVQAYMHLPLKEFLIQLKEIAWEVLLALREWKIKNGH